MTRRNRAPVEEQHENESTAGRRAQAQDRVQPPPERCEAEREAHAHLQSQAPPQRLPPTAQIPYPSHVLSSLTLTKPTSKINTHIIPPAHGHAFHLPPGKSFRVIDLHGAQVVDLMAWTSPGDPSGQHTSMSYTRYHLRGSAPPTVGESLHSNLGQRMLELKADTVKCHDLLFMACNPSFYTDMGLKGHRNCAENISGAVTGLGGGRIGWNEVVDPFNVFQNTPYYSLKALGCSKAGDYAEFENVLGKDLVVGLSCCPFEGEGFNGGKVTEVAVVTEE